MRSNVTLGRRRRRRRRRLRRQAFAYGQPHEAEGSVVEWTRGALLGRGGFGTVFKARRETTSRAPSFKLS